jgi:hypothetical protein
MQLTFSAPCSRSAASPSSCPEIGSGLGELLVELGHFLGRTLGAILVALETFELALVFFELPIDVGAGVALLALLLQEDFALGLKLAPARLDGRHAVLALGARFLERPAKLVELGS